MSGTGRGDPRLAKLLDGIRAFNRARDWGNFHSPKNLSMALVVEAAELMEQFQWLSEAESSHLMSGKRKAAEEEIGDVLIYLLNLCDKLGIDPVKAAERKLRVNRGKYPASRARGTSKKYYEL